MEHENADADAGRVPAEMLEDLRLLRGALRQIAAQLESIPGIPIVGVVGAQLGGMAGTLQSIRQMVVVGELRRRLEGFEVRAFQFVEDPAPFEMTGETLWPLLPWTSIGRTDLLACSALVELSEVGLAGLEGVSEIASKAISLTASGQADADPMVMVERLVERDALRRRLRYLRLTQPDAPRSAYMLVYFGDHGTVPSGSSLKVLSTRFQLELIEPPEDIGAMDLTALVAEAQVVISNETPLLSLAEGLGTATLALSRDRELEPDWPNRLEMPIPASQAAGPSSRRTTSESAIDGAFDELASKLASTGGSQLANTAPQRVQELSRRVRLLEEANQALRRLMERERHALLDQLSHGVASGPPTSGPATGLTPKRVSSYEERIGHLEDEIRRIYETRTMRALQPLRRVYSRLRRIR